MEGCGMRVVDLVLQGNVCSERDGSEEVKSGPSPLSESHKFFLQLSGLPKPVLPFPILSSCNGVSQTPLFIFLSPVVPPLCPALLHLMISFPVC